MTPLEPGGQNGGAGLVATSLVQHLGAIAPEWQFTLLTSVNSHAELASLDAPNVKRECVVSPSASPLFARALVDRLVPSAARVRMKYAYNALRRSRTSTEYGDLLFCPFTVPYFWRAGLKCVSIVYDLQHLSYPDFFTPEQRFNRQRQVEQACARSQRVVCISDYVRQTLLAATNVPQTRVQTVHLGLLHAPVAPNESILDRLGLRGKRYLLYPANFWPHKNHPRLFEALTLYRRQFGDVPRLVLTGAPNNYLLSLSPPENVVYAGYVSEPELAALTDGCAALVFPSLYEGFGMPVLEAMARGRPVLCSNVTSLPEVAGDAAALFDPTDPREIAAAMASVLQDPEAAADLARRGRQRAAAFGDARQMAERYLSIMRAVLAGDAC